MNDQSSTDSIVFHTWCRALTVSERAKSFSTSAGKTINNEEGMDLFNRWRLQKPFEKPKLFHQRLTSDELDETAFRYLLAESDECLTRRFVPQPRFTHLISEIFNNRKGWLEPLPPVKAQGVSSGSLLRVVEPLRQAGFTRLSRGVARLVLSNPAVQIDTKAICDHLFQELVIRLAIVTGRTMVLELQVARIQGMLDGNTPETRFNNFVQCLGIDEARRQLLNEYPVMGRLVVESINQWVTFGLEFAERLCVDWELLVQKFCTDGKLGTLVSLQPTEGDLHNGGRSVAILSFSSGVQLVYKPRPVAVGVTYGRLLDWINRQGFSPGLKVLEVLDKNTYGWVEFACQKPCDSIDQLKTFYRRQGGLLALLYTLEANDIHYGNLIAAGEHPVLVDLETLFHPSLDPSEFNRGKSSPAEALRSTVLRTGLLPRRMWTKNGESPGVDLSGLTEAEGQVTPEPVLGIEKPDTDEMYYSCKKVRFPAGKNLPTLGGNSIDITHYSSCILEGFEQLYRLLIKHREELIGPGGPLQAFAATRVRVVFRETRVYGKLLVESLHPDVMRNALERDLFLDKLWVATIRCPYLSRIIPFEKRDIQQMDIPLFTTLPGSTDLWTAAGEGISDFFPEPALKRVERKIKNLCEADLVRQCWVIEGALQSVTLAGRARERPRYPTVKVAVPATSERLLAASCAVTERIKSLAFRGQEDAGWFTWKPIGSGHWDLEPMTPLLYDGLSGVALFLAYIGEVVQFPEYSRLAREALVTARDLWREYPAEIAGIGAFSGWAGPIYLLTHLGMLWQDTGLLDEAMALLDTLEKQIDSDEQQDIISGAAGAIIVTLGLYRLRPRQKILQVAIRCGNGCCNARRWPAPVLAGRSKLPEGYRWPVCPTVLPVSPGHCWNSPQ